VSTRTAITPPKVITDFDEIWSTLLGASPDRFWARSAQQRQFERQPKCFVKYDFTDFPTNKFYDI